MGKIERPLGVSILAIYYGFGGVVTMIAGIFATIIISTFYGIETPLRIITFAISGSSTDIMLGTGIGIAIFMLGIVDLIICYGLWNLKSWALWLTIILQVLGMIVTFALSQFSWGSAGCIIPIIIVWYLDSKRELFE